MQISIKGIWQETCAAVRVADSALVESYFTNRIEMQYSEPSRVYHSLSHIEAMLRLWDRYRSHLQHPEVVAFCIFFHDVVYDGRRKDNEEQSVAQWEEFAASAGIEDPAVVFPVSRYILQTKHHLKCAPDDHADLLYFLDFDLEILGAEEERYLRYAAGVRAEYSHISDEDFQRGRGQVIKAFLETPRLYFTQEFRNLYEQRARQNLQNELAHLLPSPNR